MAQKRLTAPQFRNSKNCGKILYMEQIYKFNSGGIILDNFDKSYNISKVMDMDEEERPRERLIKFGPQYLSSPELLAIILNTGTKKEDVLAMSNRILKEYGENGLAAQTDPKVLEKNFDIPLVKSCQIAACFELGRRFFKKSKAGVIVIRTARQAFEYLKAMGDLPKEQFRGIYLDSRYRVIRDEIISVGSLTASIVHPREVFKPAIDCLAMAMVAAHNHPSGSLTPTAADIELTRQLGAAGKILGIDLLDHLIITKNKYVSIPFK
jgi:DNA repair protein RadC